VIQKNRSINPNNRKYVQIFEGLKRLEKRSGIIEKFTLTSSQTVWIHFHSNGNESNFSGFSVSIQNGKWW